MTDLDYEPRTPRPRPQGPSLLQIGGWTVSCTFGGLLGTTVASMLWFPLRFTSSGLSDLACCGCPISAVTPILAVAVLLLMEDSPVWARMLAGFSVSLVFGFVVAYLALAVLLGGVGMSGA